MSGISMYCLVFWLVFLVTRGLCVLGQEDPYTKIWLVGVHPSNKEVYIDDAGYLQSFRFALMEEVCAAAGIKCRTVWIRSSWCTGTVAGQQAVGGRGLLGGWVDACMKFNSMERMQTFDFSMSFTKARPSYFYVKKGNTFDTTDLTNKKIVFYSSHAINPSCVARQTSIKGNQLSKNQIVSIKDIAEIMQLIINGDVDAGLLSDSYEHYNDQVVAIKSTIQCFDGGLVLMTRKDSDFNTYWNIGFQKLRNSGRYGKLCQEESVKHGHDNSCV